MRIVTYNVNSINARLPNLLRWLAQSTPDVVCLQELKAPQDKFPEAAIRDAGYGVIWHGQKKLEWRRDPRRKPLPPVLPLVLKLARAGDVPEGAVAPAAEVVSTEVEPSSAPQVLEPPQGGEVVALEYADDPVLAGRPGLAATGAYARVRGAAATRPATAPIRRTGRHTMPGARRPRRCRRTARSGRSCGLASHAPAAGLAADPRGRCRQRNAGLKSRGRTAQRRGARAGSRACRGRPPRRNDGALARGVRPPRGAGR